MKKRVILGLSGGVDSSVAALLLKQQGYDVIAIFMKNWEEKDDSGVCTSAKDFEDASKVAAKLDIPLHTVNFAQKYWDNVFQYFLDEYNAGRTPNPDVLCNTEIKFKAFLDYALDLDADYIAMGHYARVEKIGDLYHLKKGLDNNKDQSYFLSNITQYALSKSLFPIGDLDKSKVRELATQYGLATATKKDSTGICFIGERNFNEFIDKYVYTKPGNIVDMDNGKIVGEHSGLMHYTVGQRRGINIGGIRGESQKPYFVAAKSLEKNELYVVRGEDNPLLYSDYCLAEKMNWLSYIPNFPHKCHAKFRYRQADIPVTIEDLGENKIKIIYDYPVKAVTPGQVAVLYDGDICLGGGFIQEAFKKS